MKFLLPSLIYALQTPMTWPDYYSNLPQFDVNGIDAMGVRQTMSAIRQKSSMSGGHDTCFLASLYIQNKTFIVRVDTGSSDTVLASSKLNSYSGSTITYTFPSGQSPVTNTYGDSSWWSGYLARINTGIVNTTIVATAPIAVMVNQSTSPVFAKGSDGVNGLMGVGFASLAVTSTSPATVMDAWFLAGQIAKNQLAMHGCPLSLQANSWLDIGNETPYSDCGGSSVTIGMPAESYYNMDVKQIAIGGVAQPLPASWQSGMWSILDSCTSNIVLPQAMYTAFQTALKNSNGFSTNLRSSSYFSQFLVGQVSLSLSDSDFIWASLPTLSFIIASQSTSFQNISLILGPRQYLQSSSSNGYYSIMVATMGKNYAILGLPVFSSFHIVTDLTQGTMMFQPGCGCATALDQYPIILKDNGPLCVCAATPTSSSGGISTNTVASLTATTTSLCSCNAWKTTAATSTSTPTTTGSVTPSSANGLSPSWLLTLLLLII